MWGGKNNLMSAIILVEKKKKRSAFERNENLVNFPSPLGFHLWNPDDDQSIRGFVIDTQHARREQKQESPR